MFCKNIFKKISFGLVIVFCFALSSKIISCESSQFNFNQDPSRYTLQFDPINQMICAIYTDESSGTVTIIRAEKKLGSSAPVKFEDFFNCSQYTHSPGVHVFCNKTAMHFQLNSIIMNYEKLNLYGEDKPVFKTKTAGPGKKGVLQPSERECIIS